jgi:hypothetical protein
MPSSVTDRAIQMIGCSTSTGSSNRRSAPAMPSSRESSLPPSTVMSPDQENSGKD